MAVDKADVERVNDKGEAVDARFVGLQVADAGRPLDVGHQVEIGVLGERHVGLAAQGDERGLDYGGRPAAHGIAGGERRHERHDDADAPLREVGDVLFTGIFDDHGFALEDVGGIAADGTDVAGDHVGPFKGFGRSFVARLAGLGQQAAERSILEFVKLARGRLFERALAADQGQCRQAKIDDRVGVAHRLGVADERLGQPRMVEARGQQRAFFGKNAGLGAVGEDDGPPFEPAADTAAVDDG